MFKVKPKQVSHLLQRQGRETSQVFMNKHKYKKEIRAFKKQEVNHLSFFIDACNFKYRDK
jgi:hypothetical protein